MNAGDIFEHPVKNTGKMVRLIAVSSDVCDNCIFKGRDNCESDDIGIRQHDITGSCSIDKVIYQQYEEKPLNLDMNKEEIIEKCLSLVDSFNGSDSKYLDLLCELIDECETRSEITKMELE